MNPLTLVAVNTNSNSYYASSGTTGKTAFAANVATTQLLAADLFGAGQYRIDVAIVATALATLATNCAINVVGHDAAGAYTSAIPLDAGLTGTIAGSFNLATTSRASGSLVVEWDGSTDLSFAITGITTPGPLAATYQITVTRIG
jgi:hypothetical protein